MENSREFRFHQLEVSWQSLMRLQQANRVIETIEGMLMKREIEVA